MIGRCIRDSIGVAVIAARLSTVSATNLLILHERKPAGLSTELTMDLADEAGDRRVFDICLVDDRESGLDPTRQAGHAGSIGLGKLHTHIAHVEGLLRKDKRDDASLISSIAALVAS